MNTPKREWASQWLANPKASFVGKQWRPNPDGAFISVNPATGEPLGSLESASKEMVDSAVVAARAAFPAWAKVPRRERAKKLEQVASLIRKHHAELATLETLDNGKLYRESFTDDIPEAADVFDYYAGWIDKYYAETVPVDEGFVNFTKRSPVGVCALIVPWNFPLVMMAWKMAPALAMGNTVLVKPAPATSYSAVRLFELLAETEIFPPGVANLLLGGPAVGDRLSHHPGVDKIAFTGSTAVGKEIVRGSAASNLKHVSLELGGKSPNIIFADAPDLDQAIQRSFTAMFSHKGEKCSEPTRLLVQAPVYDTVVSRLSELADNVVCGDPFHEVSAQGPQCTEEHMQKILRYISLGLEEGARLTAGGVRDTTGKNSHGFFVRPTIFADVNNRMRIAREEIFGPVLAIIPFHTEEEAITLANDTDYGLAAGLWTSDVSRAHRVADRLEAGMVFVNRYGCYDFASPFGGWKQSGWGHEMASHSLQAFTRLKSIWIKH